MKIKLKTVLQQVPFLLVLCVLACQQQIPEKAQWQGTAELAENKTLSFQLSLDLSGTNPSGNFIVGDEKIPIPEISHHGDSLSFIFSEYGAAMRGRWSGGNWSGLYLRYRSDTTSFAFSAHPVASARVNPGSAAQSGIPLVGTYQVYFQRDNAIDSSTTARFWLKSDSVYGTFIAPDGDYGLHVGAQQGGVVRLSRFTGWQAMMIELTQQQGTWTGKHYVRKELPRSFRLENRPSFSEEALGPRHAEIINPRAPFSFAGARLNGDTLRSTDPSLDGKVLIVDIMGTWCHNCMDESPLLQQLYSEFHKDGLEIVGLSFELKDDFDLAKKNLALYRDRYGITFPLLYCGTTDDGNVNQRLRSQIKDFFAYPTALFIDRGRKVRFVHSGFKGPGTGDQFQTQIQEFYGMVKSLLTEQQPRRRSGTSP